MKLKKAKELKKHVGAIHSVHEGGLLQRKLCNALLSNAYHELKTKETHRISIHDLSNLIGYKSNDTKKIKQSLISLQQTNVQWNVINPETGHSQWGTAGLIGEAIIEAGICYYSYTPGMRKILFEPEIYGRIDMTIQSKFKSSYGLALYENCVRYQAIPQTPWFELKVFRALMGVPEGKYKIFRDFKRRVIDKAIFEVNLHSPIRLQYEMKMMNKEVEAIRFLISNLESKEDHNMVTALSNEFGIENREAKKIIKKFGVNTVKEKIVLTDYQAQHGSGKIENKAGFLISALKNDYQPPPKLKVPSGNRSYRSYEQILVAEKIKEDLKQQKAAYIIPWFEQLELIHQKQYLDDFDTYLVSYYPILYKMYNSNNPFENVIIREILIEFLASRK